MKLRKAAEQAGVKPQTLRRWASSGVIPQMDGHVGEWPPAAVAHARIVARLRRRGHSLQRLREASAEGRLVYAYIEDLFRRGGERSLEDVAQETGLEPQLIERLWASLGLPAEALEGLAEEDARALRHVASVLEAGFPLVAFLQMARVWGQALAQIADAEVRLFHAYVHEPLMRDGVPGLQMAEDMENLAGDLLPLASPIMEYVHHRYLQQFVEQDVIGHMEMDLGEAEDLDELGRLNVAIAFADLAGYTRYTEEEGEEEALSFVERFIDAVNETLPSGAQVVKTIGDEVMIVGQDSSTLLEWAVGFQALFDERPAPRIGVHSGTAIYRDGDYFGRDVNLAARVVARARGGEVLLTDAVREAAERLDQLHLEEVGEVKLKGFSEPRVLSRATQSEAEADR